MNTHSKLLTRDDFRNGVFERDEHKCVICGDPAQDAHHIYERELWPDGGYYIENGASLCGRHHFDAEDNIILPGELHHRLGILNPPLPPGLKPGQGYTKWGEPIDGRVKYPRTPYLNSHVPSFKPDEDIAFNLYENPLRHKRIVVTEKLDGENTTMYRNGLHSRSLDFSPHPSRSFIKQLHATIAYDIPEGWRICGENMAALHTIPYDRLTSYFYVFSIWNEQNICLSWEDTVQWCELLGLDLAPVYYIGIANEMPYKDRTSYWAWPHEIYRGAFNPEAFKPHFSNDLEGFVIRNADAFPYESFSDNVAKWVNPKFSIDESRHWRNRPVVFNKIAVDKPSDL